MNLIVENVFGKVVVIGPVPAELAGCNCDLDGANCIDNSGEVDGCNEDDAD